MKLLTILLLLLSNAYASEAKRSCVDKIKCYNYTIGRSSLTMATRGEHSKNAKIPDYVYIRAVYYDSEGKRIVTREIDDIWYKKINSKYSLATARKHTESKRVNYKKASKQCQNEIENLLFENDTCD